MLEQIKKILVDTASVDAAKVTKEASLKDDLGIDSLDSVEMVLELENEFDIQIEDEEVANLVTVGDVMNLISEKTARV
ncbi:MAG: acyl carrier protein [Acholeplasmatales bacterium]|nr:acyl carrier protein [Acholeplasmatales bacterium]